MEIVRILDTQARKDPILTTTVVESGRVERRRPTKSSVEKSTDQRSTVIPLSKMKTILIMAATITATGRRVETFAAKQRPANGHPKEKETRPREFLRRLVTSTIRAFGTIDWS